MSNITALMIITVRPDFSVRHQGRVSYTALIITWRPYWSPLRYEGRVSCITSLIIPGRPAYSPLYSTKVGPPVLLQHAVVITGRPDYYDVDFYFVSIQTVANAIGSFLLPLSRSWKRPPCFPLSIGLIIHRYERLKTYFSRFQFWWWTPEKQVAL